MATRITAIGACANLGLGAVKLAAGHVCGSAALIADGAHSLSDLLTDGIAFLTYRASRKPPDSEHPFGHGKIEAVGALAVGGTLMLAAGGAALNAGCSIPTAVEPAAALVAVGSVGVKEWLFRATKAVGEREHSAVIVANAHHHRSDALSSVASCCGILGASWVPLLDPLAGMTVAVMVGSTGIRVTRRAVDELIDASIDTRLLKEFTNAAQNVAGARLTKLRARKSGPIILVDVTLRLQSNLTASAAHQIGEHVKRAVLQAAGDRVVDVSLHVDPDDRQEMTSGAPLLPPPRHIEPAIARCVARLPRPRATLHNVALFYKDNKIKATLDLAFHSPISLRHAKRRARFLRARVLHRIQILHDVHVRCDLTRRR